MFPLNTIIAWSINIIMNKKYDNNNIIIASRAYFLHLRCGRLPALLCLPFGLRVCDSKIGTSGFVSSNSENIFCTTFLKYKNNIKQELALWHLVNRLVPENA
jgi:hypothetical protein